MFFLDKKSLQVSWEWSKVEDFSYWKIPDDHVMNLPYFIACIFRTMNSDHTIIIYGPTSELIHKTYEEGNVVGNSFDTIIISFIAVGFSILMRKTIRKK